MNGNTSSYVKNNLSGSQPVSVTLKNAAGNISLNSAFLDLPSIKFTNYSLSDAVSKSNVKTTIQGAGTLSYKLGNKLYGCDGKPCTFRN